MILLKDVNVSLANADDIKKCVARELKVDESRIVSAELVRRSVDARHKNNVHFVMSFKVELSNAEDKVIAKCKNAFKYEEKPLERVVPRRDKNRLSPVVVGSGPAGLFAALTLAEYGYRPVLIERGKAVDERNRDVRDFFVTGRLNTESNIQFGEGGAGTFSDGKLNTGTKDLRKPYVLGRFVEFGSPRDILYDAEPHVGTDVLVNVVKNIRERIIGLGGQVIFECKFCDFSTRNGRLSGITCECGGKKMQIECDTLVLAIGHSARDTFEMLRDKNVRMEQKAFSLGARIEHTQQLINIGRYGEIYGNDDRLPPAAYKLANHIDGRGVYTFCMCPGGMVVPAASENGGVVTNGMSYHARDMKNANSAVLVGVLPEDFGSDDVLAGMHLQQRIEKAAFDLSGSYKAPAQLVGDFIQGCNSVALGEVEPSYPIGVNLSNLDFLPEFVRVTMKKGIESFGRKIRGFDRADAVLTGPETRSSSPVRILRDDQLESNVGGIYPCGEGAGYAGGIVSSAVDGIRCAERIISKQ